MVIVKVNDDEFYLDGYLKENLDQIKELINKKWDFVIICDGMERCIAGDTIINVNRATLGKRYKIKWIYNQMKGNPDKLPYLSSKPWNLDIPTYVRSYNGHEIRLHKLKDVLYNGKKEVWKLLLEDGKSIGATPDHKIMTNEGFIPLQNLDLKKHLVMCDTPRPKKQKQLYRHRWRDIHLKGLDYHKYAQPTEKGKPLRRVKIQVAIYEAQLNNLSFSKFLEIVSSDESKAKELQYVDPDKYVVHHKDFNHYNNALENLEMITYEEHIKIHSEEMYKSFGQGVPFFVRIKSIESVGMKDVYDIICEEPHHNFVANGMVVHNCGKSTLAKQMAYYLDPSFNIDRVCFTAYEFRDRCLKADKGQAVVFDEAFRGMGARQSMTYINNMIMTVLTEVGQRNLYMIFVLPSFFELDRYPAIHRSEFLMHVEAPKRERGFFKAYDRERKIDLYFKGKKFYQYHVAQPNFFGRFTKFDPIPEDEYNAKKNKSLQGLADKVAPADRLMKKITRLENCMVFMDHHLRTKYGYLPKDIALVYGLTEGTYRKELAFIIEKIKLENSENLKKSEVADGDTYKTKNNLSEGEEAEKIAEVGESLPNDSSVSLDTEANKEEEV